MDLHVLNTGIHEAIIGFIQEGRAFALATVLHAAGSTPQKAGARAIIDAAGSLWGTIGGGLLEARALRTAVEAIRTGRPRVFDFPFSGCDAGEGEPICGGTMRVLIDPLAAAHAEAYAQAAAARRQRRRGVLVTSVRGQDPPGVAVRWRPADAEPADAGGRASCPPREWEQETPGPELPDPDSGFPRAADLRASLAAEEPAHLAGVCPRTGLALETLIEPVIPAPQLLIVGGGHVAQSLARHASLVGFELVIVEDRPEFAREELFPPGAAVHCGDVGGILRDFPTDADTYVAIVTRGHRHDAEALAACIRKPAAYIGMMGSRRKVALVRQKFIESGLASAEEWERVHAPIGLAIGARTVPEIAASIVAELIAVRRKAGARRC